MLNEWTMRCAVFIIPVTLALPLVGTDLCGLSKCTSDHRTVRVGENSWRILENIFLTVNSASLESDYLIVVNLILFYKW